MKFPLKIDQFYLEADTEAFPYGEVGQPGSILDIALGQGIRISHSCGGVCSCTTCHVWVLKGIESCSPPSQAELNRLGEVYGRQRNSRLACQCVPDGSTAIEVEIP